MKMKIVALTNMMIVIMLLGIAVSAITPAPWHWVPLGMMLSIIVYIAKRISILATSPSRKRNSGMTLIELMVILSLISIVAILIYIFALSDNPELKKWTAIWLLFF